MEVSEAQQKMQQEALQNAARRCFVVITTVMCRGLLHDLTEQPLAPPVHTARCLVVVGLESSRGFFGREKSMKTPSPRNYSGGFPADLSRRD